MLRDDSFFRCSCERCHHSLQSCGNCHHLYDDCLARARQGLLRRMPRLCSFQKSQSSWFLCLHTAREPVVMHPRLWDHEVPLVMSQVFQATGQRILHTWVVASRLNLVSDLAIYPSSWSGLHCGFAADYLQCSPSVLD